MANTIPSTGSRPDLATARPAQTERLLLIVVALAGLLAPLNSTMIAVALPGIIADFNADVGVAGWLVTGYLIAMASLQPVAGKLGDRLGRRNLMLAGMVYFGLVSLGAALAPNLAVLLFFRIQQGIAGAITFPNGSALLREIVPAHRRASSFGLIGATMGIAAASGPPLGGFLTGAIGWRAIFYMNVPFILPALLLGWRTIPATTRQRSNHAFDVLGAVWLSITLISLAWTLTQSRGGNRAVLLPGMVVAILLAAGFVIYEARHADPVLQPRLFRHRSFAAACATIGFSNLAMYSTLLTVPMLLAQRAGWSELHIGLVLTALSAASVIFAPLGGRLADNWGRRWPTVAGLALSAVGMAALAFGGAAIGSPLLLFALATAGVGLGLAGSGMQTAAIESVAAKQSGVAAGVFSTSRYLGSIVGASVLAALLNPAAGGEPAFQAVFYMVLAGALISLLTSLGLHDRPTSDKDGV